MAAAGYDLERQARPTGSTRSAHYLELHIEQGPRLEAAGIEIGVVTSIVGLAATASG